MKNYSVHLKSPVSTSFRCQKAADSLDIDTNKKSEHKLTINADLTTDFSVGLIIGASGSGKTTLAKEIYGNEPFKKIIVDELPIIEQFPENMNYSDCAEILNGVGLSSVPCWIRPVYTLSNGQKSRAEVALYLAQSCKTIVIDEWTSVVDRTVGKAMSDNIQKTIRRGNKQIILISCHYDVLEWLNPCWVIDCNKQEFIDRRWLWQNYQRKEKLEFQIRRVSRKSWSMFSKYHYLSERLPGGTIETFGLFLGDDQIGFQCFANYVPYRKNSFKKMQMHSNRTVIHPDYMGFGLGMIMVNELSALLCEKYDIRAKFSSMPMYKSRLKHPDKWKLCEVKRAIKKVSGGGNMTKNIFRQKVKTYSFKWIENNKRGKP